MADFSPLVFPALPGDSRIIEQTPIPAWPGSQAGAFRLSPSRVLPDVPLLMRTGGRKTWDPSGPVARAVADAIQEAGQLIQPSAAWAVLPTTGLNQPGHPAAALAACLPGELLGQNGLAGAQALAVVVCTIGSSLENQSRRHFSENEPLQGYMLDQAGGLSVAALGSLAEAALSANRSTIRWAPGDGGVSSLSAADQELAAQQAIFDLVPAQAIGVTLMDSLMMVPAKSLTFMLLLGEDLSQKRCFIPCRRCAWNGNCHYQPERKDG